MGLQSGDNRDQDVKQQLMSLIGDALIIANEAQFDVFNALTLMDNVPFLKDLKVDIILFCLIHTFTEILFVPLVWGWRWLFKFLPLQLADCKVSWYDQ